MTRPFRSPYAGYDVLAKWETPSFNDLTRQVLRNRLTKVPARRFFNEREWAVLGALCDAAMPQDERDAPVPIAPWIDASLTEGHGAGTRYATMPPDRDAWRRGLAALDAEARQRHAQGFAELSRPVRSDILKSIDAGHTRASEWGDMPPRKFFRDLALKQIVQIYYSAPEAMSEIGFGGPASPRGYVRLAPDRFDPWEAPRGDWQDLEDD